MPTFFRFHHPPRHCAVSFMAAFLAVAAPYVYAQEAKPDETKVTYPSIKGHPLPEVSTFSGVRTEARSLPRDPFLDASVLPELTLRQATKIDNSAPSSYGEKNFNEDLLLSSERRLAVDAILLNPKPGAPDTAIINQRPFSTGEQVPVQVDTAEPATFKKLAADRHVPCLDLGSSAPVTKPKPGAPKINGTLCVFLEVGRITPKGVALRFPDGHTDVAVLPYNPVIHLDSTHPTVR